MKKRAYKIFFVCAVFSILLSSLCVFSSADYEYIPAVGTYRNGGLPFGDKTIVIYVPKGQNSYQYSTWYFLARSEYVDSNFSNNYTWYIDSNRLYLGSYAKIIQIQVWNDGTYATSNVGTFDQNLQMFIYDVSIGVRPYVQATIDEHYLGLHLSQAVAAGMLTQPSHGFPIYVGDYPSTSDQIISSFSEDLSDQSALMTAYFNAIDEDLSELNSKVDSLRTQNGEMVTEILSGVDEAASQAADDVNNAGEDMSDIDDDVSDVNSIVDTLDEWISQLDDYSETIDEAASDVADSMEQGKSLISGFLGICPPIVIALFAFALVFIVVRKVIGR